MGKANSVAQEFNKAAPGANTNILDANVTPVQMGTDSPIFRVTACLAVSSVLNVVITDSDGNSETIGLNDNAAITADAMFREAFAVRSDYTYNFQVETDGEIKLLLVDQINDGVI